MQSIWDEKIVQTSIDLKVESDRIVLNHSTWGTSGVASFKITPTYLNDILESIKLIVREDKHLHNLLLTISSPHTGLKTNGYKSKITLQELHDYIKTHVSEDLPKQLKSIEDAKKAATSCRFI